MQSHPRAKPPPSTTTLASFHELVNQTHSIQAIHMHLQTQEIKNTQFACWFQVIQVSNMHSNKIVIMADYLYF
jgi:hypothetical protein